MASKRFRDLVHLRQPGHSVPVGTIARRHNVTATLSSVDESGEVVFGEEVPIEVEFAWKELPAERAGSDERRIWVGFEVQTHDSRIRNCTAVLATHPYSTDWFDWADFKRTFKRSREEREHQLRAPTETVKRRLRSKAELGVEIFETRKGWLTARLSMPTRTAGLAIKSPRGLKTGDVWKSVEVAMNGRHGRDERSDLWCFGACRDFERCREFLRISERAANLLDRTDDGTLFSRAQGPVPPREIGATARSLAKPVLESAILKALAGASPKLETLGRTRSVSRLMEGIYLDTMYNLVRRLRERESGGKVQGIDIERAVGTPEPTDKRSFDEQISYFRKEFTHRRPPEDVRCAIEGVLSSGSGEERESICAALVAWQEIGYRIPRVLEIPLGRIVADPAEPLSLRKAARLVLSMMRSDKPPVRS